MTALASRTTLVLNGEWRPINVIASRKAMNKVFAGRALCLDPRTFATYTWEQWVDEWSDVKSATDIGIEKATSMLPEIIVCTHYKGMGYKVHNKGVPKFSRRNLFLRDRNVCQCCGETFPCNELTMGHIIPKQRKGEVTWTNIVLMCVQCNQKMANRTPEEAGMKLLRKAFVPTAKDLRLSPEDRIRQRMSENTPKVWEQFVGKLSEEDKVASFMYWNTELK